MYNAGAGPVQVPPRRPLPGPLHPRAARRGAHRQPRGAIYNCSYLYLFFNDSYITRGLRVEVLTLNMAEERPCIGAAIYIYIYIKGGPLADSRTNIRTGAAAGYRQRCGSRRGAGISLSLSLSLSLGEGRGSNPGPDDAEMGALPTAPHTPYILLDAIYRNP
jgi:hypothetical protein